MRHEPVQSTSKWHLISSHSSLRILPCHDGARSDSQTTQPPLCPGLSTFTQEEFNDTCSLASMVYPDVTLALCPEVMGPHQPRAQRPRGWEQRALAVRGYAPNLTLHIRLRLMWQRTSLVERGDVMMGFRKSHIHITKKKSMVCILSVACPFL